MRFLIAFALALLPVLSHAQERDSYFVSYAAYDAFVSDHITQRDFIPMIQRLGGRDEYTVEQLQSLNGRFHAIYPRNFTDGAVIRKTDLGAGFSQEARVYWGRGSGYIYYFAMLHQRADGVVVLTFNMNSDVTEIMKEF